jgi:hypothetical protein
LTDLAVALDAVLLEKRLERFHIVRRNGEGGNAEEAY